MEYIYICIYICIYIIHMVHTWLWSIVFRRSLILPKFYRLTSLVVRQSYECPSAGRTTQKNMGQKHIVKYQELIIYHNKIVSILWDIVLGQETPVTQSPVYVIMMVADVLAPNRRQAISNHHADSSMIKVYHSGTCIILCNIHTLHYSY